MRLALETGDISVNEMAERLGYSRSTISRWLNDQDPPRAAVMAQWALITGVDSGWLEHGIAGGPAPDPGSGRSSELERLTRAKKPRGRAIRHDMTTRQYLPALVAAA